MLSASKLVKLYTIPGLRRIARRQLLKRALDLPLCVEIGQKVEFPHNGIGTVIHPYTSIGDNVKIYQNVTIGRGDVWDQYNRDSGLHFTICEGAILGAGCKIIASKGELVVGKGTIIGANAVLLESTGENEIWAGVPAKKVGVRLIEESCSE